jgi:D-methionine transport system ATP-binding protein
MIELDGVGKTYVSGESSIAVALADIDLRIRVGEIFGVIGRSGAGKSTLVRCMNLLVRPTVGTVRIDGVELTALRERELRRERREIGMVFQHFSLLASRTVYANVAFPLELAGTPRGEIDGTVTSLLSFVGLFELRDRYPGQISGGQAQRVGIARALATRPKVLLCDEATSALDPQTTESILALLRETNRAFGVTIVIITHEMRVVRAICDRVAVLEAGRIVEIATPQEIVEAPRSATARAFFSGDGAEITAIGS